MPATDDYSSPDERFDALFDQAMELPQAERAAFIREACRDDAPMQQQLEELVASEDGRSDFMDDPTLGTEEGTEKADPLVGTSIGSYKLLQHLGEGGYGVVYLAEQRAPVTRRVALKVIKLGMDTKQVIARFEAERQALAMMDHPNIAKVFDAGATDAGRSYFVMEWVRGLPVTDYCDQVKLPVADRLKLFVNVCQAVQHAHQKGIIHRDLKPNNILVTLHDGVPVPKVIDFGIAKATNFRLTEHTLFTDFRQFVGTPVYTSPEQMEMSGFDVDTRSDIYSLGVLLYELLTGTTPVPVESLRKAAYAEIQRTILETDPPTASSRVSSLANARQVEVAATRTASPSKLRQLLRGDLDWILTKALEKDRERRYESATAFGKDVQRFLDGEPVSAGAPSPLYRVRRFVSRHKAVVAVMLALLAGGFVSFWQAVRASRGEMETRRSLYIADMNVAQEALNDGNMERAITTLERHLPKQGERDLRHWEWHYLWSQTQRHEFTLLADDDSNDAEPPDPLFDLSLSRNGKWLASTAMNGRVRVWDLKRRTEKFQFKIPAGNFAWTDFSPDSRYLVASGQDWDTDSAHASEQPLPAGQDTEASRSSISVWELASEQAAQTFSLAPSKFACSPRFVTDSLICAGGSQGCLWFCEMDTGETHAIKAHDAEIEWVTVAGNVVVTSAADGIKQWDAASRRVVSTLPIDNKRFTIAEISADARRIAVFNIHELGVTIHDALTWEVLKVLHADFDVYAVRFNHDDTLFAICEGNGTIRLYDTETWQEQDRYHLRSHQVNDCAPSHDGSTILAGGENGVITALPGRPSQRGVLRSSGMQLNTLRYSPNGRYLASGTGEGLVELWEAERETKLLEIPAQVAKRSFPPNFRVDFHDFSPDSAHFAVAQQGDDGFTVDIWDLVTLERIDQMAHPTRVNAVAYSPDGHFLATGCRGEEGIRIWDLRERQVIAHLNEGKSIQCLTFSPDSSILASKAWDNEGVQVWDLATEKRIALLDAHVEPFGDTNAVLFSPDGRWLATAGYDRQVILWDTVSWKPAKRFLGHTWLVVDLAFTPDGKRLASSSPENWCRVWDVESGRELARFPGVTVDFSPDGHALAVGGRYLPPGGLKTESPDESTIRIHRAPRSTSVD